MLRYWLTGLGIASALSVAGCSSDDGGPPAGNVGDVTIVASEDGTVEVIVAGKTLFALAATGPVARTFIDAPGNIGTKEFRRINEQVDPLSVRVIANGGT
ncbi:MAG: hypothetical protein JRE81_09710, partial [Deltaproteobacteria bacterium]|nr:hypothetical protein [Deltaproteobacteria bacterium]